MLEGVVESKSEGWIDVEVDSRIIWEGEGEVDREEESKMEWGI